MGKMDGVLGAMAACSASCITHPFDTLKVRMSRQKEGDGGKVKNLRSFAGDIYREGGIRSFYPGVSATILRQILFSGTRFALNSALRVWQKETKNPYWLMLPEVGKKMACGGIAGGIGAALACPAELALVRMQADLAYQPSLRRNYRNVFEAMRRIAQEEGLSQLYRGLVPIVVRGVCVTAAQFTTQEQSKLFLMESLGWANDLKTQLTSATVAGLVSSCTVQPIDILKVRMMAAQKGSVASEQGGKTGDRPRVYRSTFHCAMTIIKVEGVFGLYKGLVATAMRQCPQVILMWVFVQQYTKFYEEAYKSYQQSNNPSGAKR